MPQKRKAAGVNDEHQHVVAHPHDNVEHWLPWASWLAEQVERIFAEARPSRRKAGDDPAERPNRATSFQRAFFLQLSTLPASTEAELIDRARQVGVPAECAIAFWRSYSEQCFKNAVQLE
jgi:hypothetical protein